jgi:hypothetical protein
MALTFSIFLILSWVGSLLILGLIARILAALFSAKSRELIKTHPRRHLIWIFSVIVSWIFLTEFPDYLIHKHRVESTRKFIELMQHDLKADSRFVNVGLDTNHLHFISVTGTVSSAEQKQILYDLVRSNRTVFYAPVDTDVTVVTNFNK